VVVRLHPEAQAEFTEAIAFYEEQAPGLGRDFFDEVQRVLQNIAENPALGSPLELPFRRAFCRRFPFAVVYREEPGHVHVRAIMHLRRRPAYWKERG
jgi:toxin ParE1/3/4